MLPLERFAKVWMIALIVIFTLYFTVIAVMEARQIEPTFLQRIGLLAAALGTLGVIAGGDRILSWLKRDESDATDERDRLIQYRATTIGYYVLMAGMIVVGCVLPFLTRGWEIVHAALLAIALAEIAQSGLVLVYYRQGLRA